MVMQRVSLMLGAGAVAGLVLTFAVRKVVGMVIYFDAQKEAGEIAVVTLTLIAAGLLSALIPAVGAATIEPIQALRAE
jgi:ABC-type antimicrobial peptide transport system permease subunit